MKVTMEDHDMAQPEIQEQTAERYLELIKAIRGQIQDFVSDYERNDEREDWDSVAACTNAIMQLDMSAHGAIEWIEVHAGIRPDPRDMDPMMQALRGGGQIPTEDAEEIDSGGNYL